MRPVDAASRTFVRAGSEADVAAVRSLLGRLHQAVYGPLLGPDVTQARHDEWHAPAALAHQISQPDASFLVAEDAVAGIVAHAFASARTPARLDVFRLYVDLPFQGRGLGRRLLEALFARHPEAAVARLHVAAENERALRFYDRLGFVRTGEVREDDVLSVRLERALP